MLELAIHPLPLTPERRDALTEAKLLLAGAPKIMPVQAQPGAGRILAFETPPFAPWEGYALVSDKTSTEALAEALGWAVGFVERDSRVTSMAGWLSKVFGQKVAEVQDE